MSEKIPPPDVFWNTILLGDWYGKNLSNVRDSWIELDSLAYVEHACKPYLTFSVDATRKRYPALSMQVKYRLKIFSL